MEKIIEFDNAAKLKGVATDFSQISQSYLFTHITSGNDARLLIDTTPMKSAGTILLLVRSGRPFDIEINLTRYTIRPDSFITIFPGNVVKLIEEPNPDLEAYAMFFDTKFLQNININMSAIATPPMVQRPTPVLDLDDGESDLLVRYFELLHLNALDSTNPQISKSIASSILAAVLYQLVLFHHRRIRGFLDTDHTGKPMGRRHDYVREFVKLVHVHHVNERSVSFYADKLFISPKYLTLLVKEATGRSAAKWIDDFVIMEAKNLLRFSGKNIQQVAYALNFSTQSSFGKYFKHLTGMSPTEYQKS